jgi:hypothetical protein
MTYLNDASQYAFDLTAAAEAGDWERYRNTQAQLSAETTQALITRAIVTEKRRDETVREMDSKHPGFSRALRSNQKNLQEQRPTLAQAISVAEQDPQLQENLLQLYESANDYLRSNLTMQRTGSAGSHSPTRTHSSANSLATSAARQQLIEEFEAKYGDVAVDSGDTSQHVIR